MAQAELSGGSATSNEEVTWETVQGVFDRVSDRSWQLLAEDLTVYLRPDGKDWVLGEGGFGRVCPPPPPSPPSPSGIHTPNLTTQVFQHASDMHLFSRTYGFVFVSDCVCR